MFGAFTLGAGADHYLKASPKVIPLTQWEKVPMMGFFNENEVEKQVLDPQEAESYINTVIDPLDGKKVICQMLRWQY